VILGPHWHRFSGPEAVCERIAGADVFFPPGAFGQSHLELADELVEDLFVDELRQPPRATFVYPHPDQHALALELRAAELDELVDERLRMWT